MKFYIYELYFAIEVKQFKIIWPFKYTCSKTRNKLLSGLIHCRYPSLVKYKMNLWSSNRRATKQPTHAWDCTIKVHKFTKRILSSRLAAHTTCVEYIETNSRCFANDIFPPRSWINAASSRHHNATPIFHPLQNHYVVGRQWDYIRKYSPLCVFSYYEVKCKVLPLDVFERLFVC